MPNAELVGRVAAEAARRLYRDPNAKIAPRGVPAMRVWVNLEAADRAGLSFPLAFLASVDKLHRGIPRPARSEDAR